MRIDRNFVREIFLAMQEHEDYVISSHTLMQKLGVKGRAQAVVELIRLKEITL